MANEQIVSTKMARVFITESLSRPDLTPVFLTCAIPGEISQSFGDRTAVQCPAPNRIGGYVTVLTTEGAPENVETSIEARISPNQRSRLLALARNKIPFDMHIHLNAQGIDPRVFNRWTKKYYFQSCRISSASIEALGNFDADEPVSESVDLSAEDWAEVIALDYTERASSVVDKEITGIYAYHTGDVTKPYREQFWLFATGVAAGGSPGTPPDIIYSLDAGSNWYAFDVNSMTSSDGSTAIAVVGNYVAIISNDTASMHYALLSDFDGVTVPTFTEVSTGFVAGKAPLCMVSVGATAFIGGEGGYVYKTTDPSAGVTVLSAAASTTQNINAINALDENTVIAVGDNKAVLISVDGENFSPVTGPATAANLTAAAVLTVDNYIVGGSGGRLHYTTNRGKSWTEKSFPSSASGSVADIKFVLTGIGYMIHTLSGKGYLLQTTDGGNTWQRVPEGGIIAADRFNSIGVVPGEPNFVALGGLGDDASDGVVVVGEAL